MLEVAISKNRYTFNYILDFEISRDINSNLVLSHNKSDLTGIDVFLRSDKQYVKETNYLTLFIKFTLST